MKLSVFRISEILLIAGMILVGLVLYPSLPVMMPSHWGITGEVDGWMSREMAVLFIPVLTIVLAVFLPWLERFDPEKHRYPEFRRSWELLQLALVAFFTYVYALQLCASLNPDFSLHTGRAVIGGIGVLFAVLGYAFRSMKKNYFIGIRTPWTLASDRVWDETHRFGATLWIIAGISILLEAVVWVGRPWVVFFGVMIVAVVVPIVQSYVLFQKHVRRK
jgi:uncharacterized membrane protein